MHPVIYVVSGVLTAIYYLFVVIELLIGDYKSKKDFLIDFCIPFGALPRLMIRELRKLR